MNRYRLRWSDMLYNEAMKIIIPDWKLVKTMFNNNYLLVDALLEYKGREIELCVPYQPFIWAIRFLKEDKQKLIKNGNAVITLMKTYKRINHGIIIKEVTQWQKDSGL